MEKTKGNGGDRPDGDYDPQISYDLHDQAIDHSWGDFRTWAIIIGLSAGLVISTLIIFAIVGKHTLQHWNLGYPPTSPDIILPMP